MRRRFTAIAAALAAIEAVACVPDPRLWGTAGGSGGGAVESSPTSDTVNGGEYAKNNQYRMTFTVGEPVQVESNQSTNASYRLQSGLVGQIGSQP